MKSGYLVAESLLGGAKWMTQKTRLPAGGAPLVVTDAWGDVHLEGFRCEGGRALVLGY